jgi:hypothetical protein
MNLKSILVDKGFEFQSLDEVLVCQFRDQPQPGEDAWFHTLYPGLDQLEIQCLKTDLGLSYRLPEGVKASVQAYKLEVLDNKFYEAFLVDFNGARLFAGHLNFFGLCRENPWSTKQPLELCSGQELWTAKRNAASHICFGGYRWDGSLLGCSNLDGSVIRCMSGGAVLNKWASIAEFLASEVERLNVHFDKHGYLRSSDTPTHP